MSRNRPKREEANHAAAAASSHRTCSSCYFKADNSTTLKQHGYAYHTKCLRCRTMSDSTRDEYHEHFPGSQWHKFCDICKLDFPSIKSLAEHCRSSHPAIGMTTVVVADRRYACGLCNKSFEGEEKLEAHLQRDHVRCYLCSQEFRDKNSLIDHLSTSTRHHFCFLCETDYLTFEALRKHLSSVHDATGTHLITSTRHRYCSLCRTVYPTSQAFRKHLSSAHDKTGPQEGEEDQGFHRQAKGSSYTKAAESLSRLTGFLDKLEEYNPEFANLVKIQTLAYNSRLDLSDDEDESDDDEENSEIEYGSDDGDHTGCQYCDEEFDTLLDTTFHEYDNHQWCEICNKQFSSRKALHEHFLVTRGHNFCFECDKSFFLKQMLHGHRKDVWHASSSNTPQTLSDVGVRKKVYACDDCFEVYTSEEDLRRHLDNNHFDCLQCDKEFTSRKGLMQHYSESRRHHFCCECEMNLPSRQELNEHLRLGRHRD